MATIVGTESGKWKAVVRRHGAGLRLKVRTFARKDDAAAWARMVESEAERGVWRDTSAADSMTLRDAFDRYGSEVAGKMRAAREELSILGILRGERIAALRLSKVTSADIAALRDHWLRAVKPATVRRRFHTLSHVFTVARREWRMDGLANPVADVSVPREDPARDRRPTQVEIDAIKAACAAGCRTPWTRNLPDLIDFAIETAMRREEIYLAEWRHADLEARTLFIPKTKNGEARTVPLSTRACEILGALPHDDSGKVFAGWPSNSAVGTAFRKTVARARRRYTAECKAAGTKPDPRFLADLRFHDLRHEATSRLAQVPGLSVHMLAKITGHKTLSMLMRYYNPTAQELAKLLT